MPYRGTELSLFLMDKQFKVQLFQNGSKLTALFGIKPSAGSDILHTTKAE